MSRIESLLQFDINDRPGCLFRELLGRRRSKMTHELVYTVALLVCICIGNVASLDLDATCYEDTDCTGVDPAKANSHCLRSVSNCPYGMCKCASGYAAVGGSCNAVLAVTETCTNTAECVKDMVEWTLTCDTTCKCPDTETYSATYKICQASGKKALGESECSDNADCDETDNAVCEASTCACSAGYVTDTTAQTCTTPYLGQACKSSPGCVERLSVSGDSSEQVPDCTNDVCTCGSGSSEVVVNGVSICVTTVTSGYNPGVACTDLNDCTSNLCFQCPGAAAAYCVGEPSSSGAMSTIKHLTGIALAGFLLVTSYAI